MSWMPNQQSLVRSLLLLILYSVFILEVVNFFALFILLLVIAALQLRFFRLHFSMDSFAEERKSFSRSIKDILKSRERRNLFIATLSFSVAMLYRMIFNMLKLIYNAEDSDAAHPENILEKLEG